MTMSGPEVVARADAAKISSILRNVIDNAMRASGRRERCISWYASTDQLAIADICDSGSRRAAGRSRADFRTPGTT